MEPKTKREAENMIAAEEKNAESRARASLRSRARGHVHEMMNHSEAAQRHSAEAARLRALLPTLPEAL